MPLGRSTLSECLQPLSVTPSDVSGLPQYNAVQESATTRLDDSALAIEEKDVVKALGVFALYLLFSTLGMCLPSQYHC